jgi:ElaB/YqjD/DUF883 family membrane-anchored ribosome-binding protein
MLKIWEDISEDIDKLAKKTGEEARKINTKIKNEIDPVVKSAKSIDIKKDLRKLAKKGDELVDETGTAAEKLASEMKADLNSIKERMGLQERLEKSINEKKEIMDIIAKTDRLAELTGNAAKKLANEIKGDIKKLGEKSNISE